MMNVSSFAVPFMKPRVSDTSIRSDDSGQMKGDDTNIKTKFTKDAINIIIHLM